jgi:hypothetical protein
LPGLLLRAALLTGAGAVPSFAAADIEGLEVEVDLRAVASDSPLTSFTAGGTGELRFDEEHDGLRLGRLLIDYRAQPFETLTTQLTLSATGDNDKNPIDVTEAYLEWRPYPKSMWRSRARLGAFYPPVSLENRGIGWQSIYSISASALNTWVGEEIRAIGLEYEITAMGATKQRPFDIGLVAGVYGWNDPMGVLIFERGWAIHDRQTALFGRLPDPLGPGAGTSRHGLEFFHEIDDRAGYYVGGDLRYSNWLVARVLHYDNRGDPAAFNDYEPAWLSRFDAIGARFELPGEFTIITQWMGGDTSVGESADGRGFLIVDFDAMFVLLSKAFGPHRLTLRYDDFYTDTVRNEEIFDSSQDGDGWLLAYLFDYDEHWRFAAEALDIDTTLAPRTLLGLPAHAAERTLQIQVAYRF